MNTVLVSWVVYIDYPGGSLVYAAQKFNDLTPTKVRIISTNLKLIRIFLELKGLTSHKNTHEREPHIIECWI